MIPPPNARLINVTSLLLGSEKSQAAARSAALAEQKSRLLPADRMRFDAELLRTSGKCRSDISNWKVLNFKSVFEI